VTINSAGARFTRASHQQRIAGHVPSLDDLGNQKVIVSIGGNAMDEVLSFFGFIGHAIEQVLIYVESHHWIFGFLAVGYIFYLHDRGLHARFDAIDKRLDEIRKRLAVEY
jgi:hypothetical protein